VRRPELACASAEDPRDKKTGPESLEHECSFLDLGFAQIVDRFTKNTFGLLPINYMIIIRLRGHCKEVAPPRLRGEISWLSNLALIIVHISN
jgi:hypothetical protein